MSGARPTAFPQSAVGFHEASPADVNDPLGIGDSRGGRRARAPLAVEVLRELGPEDLPALQQRAAAQAPGQSLARIRHSHHQLAQLLAQGKEQAEVALITGYSPAYISTIKNDPTFQELLSHYASVTEAAFVDVMERLRVLGLNSIDELQQRLEEDPEAWSRRELMELAELTLLKPIQAIRGGGQALNGGQGAAGGVSVSVNFVTANHESKTIDVTPSHEP